MDSSIISHYLHDFLTNNKQFHGYVDFFVELFGVEELIDEYGGSRRSGHKPVEIFKYLLGLVFDDISFNRDLKRSDAPFSHSSVRRFLKNPKMDWEMFTTKLAYRVFEFLYPKYENPQAKLYLILDDTDYERPYTRFADDISIQKKHKDDSFYSGYRVSTISIYYNSLILPVNAVPISSEKTSKMLYQANNRTESEVVGRRQSQMRSKSTHVVREQFRRAYEVGFRAKSVVFDTWYTYPRTILNILDDGLAVVGAVKNAKTRFLFEGEQLRVGEIFDRLIKVNPETNEDGIFFAPIVRARVDEREFSVRLVFAENVHEKRPYFCVLSTDCLLDPSKIIAIYRFRWSLETIFKELKKKTLSLTGLDQSLTAEGIAANIAIVLCRYLLLVSARALDGEDERSIEDQFYVCREGERSVNEINTIVKVLQDLIPGLASQYDLNEQEFAESVAKHLENSEIIRELLSKIPKLNFDEANDDEK